VIDKINVLNYFETVVQNSNVSNRLVNSAFMNLLVKLLKTSKNVNLKVWFFIDLIPNFQNKGKSVLYNRTIDKTCHRD